MGPIGLSLVSMDDVGIRNDGTRGEAGRGYPRAQSNGKSDPRRTCHGYLPPNPSGQDCWRRSAHARFVPGALNGGERQPQYGNNTVP